MCTVCGCGEGQTQIEGAPGAHTHTHADGTLHSHSHDPAVRAGADAVLAASVFHFGELTVAQVKAALRAEGFEVR